MTDRGHSRPRFALRAAASACLATVLGLAATSAHALTFAAPSGAPVALAGSPMDVVSADFNGDKKGDLAISEEGSGANDVRILLGNGTGHFTEAPGSPVGALTNVTRLAAGDLNNDHKPELGAIVSGSSAGWATLLPDQQGTWQRHIGGTSLPTFGAGGPIDLALANFDRDANLDYAFVDPGSNDNLLVVQGDGDGGTLPWNPPGFGDTAPFSGAELSTAQNAVAVLTGDFDGDGWPDIATVETDTATSAGSLEVWTNFQASDNQVDPGVLSASDFRPGPPVSLSSATPLRAVTADLNRDGQLDFAVLNEDGSVSVVLSDGEGGYTPARTYSPMGTGATGGAIAFGDLNGDGVPDLIVGGNGTAGNELAVMLGRGDGTFVSGGAIPVAATPDGVAVADLNGDGRADLGAVSNSSTSLIALLNTSKPELSLASTAVKFTTQARSTLSAPRSLTVTNTGPVPISPGSFHLTGKNPGDFILDTSACRDELLQGQSCAVRVYFAPAAKGARTATLALSNDLWQGVTLSGTGGALPTGPRGPRGPAGKPGKNGQVTCKVTSPKHVSCRVVYVTVSHGTRVQARLVRRGHTVARGRLVHGVLHLSSTQHLRRGSYVLIVSFRLRHRTVTARQTVRVG